MTVTRHARRSVETEVIYDDAERPNRRLAAPAKANSSMVVNPLLR
jgi:hypothetical protein